MNYDPPTLTNAATASDGMSITLTFDQDLKGTTVPNAHFTVSVDDEAASLSGTNAAVSGTTVTLSLTDTLIGANTVTVRYTDPTDADDLSAIQDLLGNDAASFTADMVTNTVAADIPDAPTGLTATTTRTRDVTLDWTAPSDIGSSAISGYQIEVSTDSATNWETAEADTGSTDTSYKHEGLTPNTRYDYRVSAINADGVGTASTTINTTTGGVVTISSITLTGEPDPEMRIDDDYYQGSREPGANQDTIEVTVTFSAAVDVRTPTTSKAIALEIAGQTKLATYSSGTGTTALVYKYTVEPGLEDRDGVSFAANPLRGEGIVTKDKGAGFEADLSHAAIADDDGHKVDSIRPRVIYAEQSPGDPTTATFTIEFSEEITFTGIALIGTTNGAEIEITLDLTNVTISGNIIEFGQVFPFVAAGMTFGVSMTATQDVAENAPSAQITNYPFTSAATTPTAPQNLTALPGNGRVTLTWDAPESDGGRAIDSYESRYSSDGGGNWSDWTEIPDSGPGGMNARATGSWGSPTGRRTRSSCARSPPPTVTAPPRRPPACRASRARLGWRCHRPHLAGRRGRRYRDRHGDGKEQRGNGAGGGGRGHGLDRERHRNGGRGLRELERDGHLRRRRLRARRGRHPLGGLQEPAADHHRGRRRRRGRDVRDTAGGERRLGERRVARGRNHRHHHRRRRGARGADAHRRGRRRGSDTRVDRARERGARPPSTATTIGSATPP